MNPSPRYRINTPDVVEEVFDDEVIVVNLRAGAYYTLGGTGAAIWKSLQGSASIDEVLGHLQAGYRGDASTVRAATESLIRELEGEALIVPLADGTPAPPLRVNGATPAHPLPFEAPQLKKYTDMRDLLVLDPIHDVDESGWPARRP